MTPGDVAAFPYVAEGGQNNGCNPELEPGMTRHQWLAGKAMAALISTGMNFADEENGLYGWDWIAVAAHSMADSMLAEEQLRKEEHDPS